MLDRDGISTAHRADMTALQCQPGPMKYSFKELRYAIHGIRQDRIQALSLGKMQFQRKGRQMGLHMDR